MNEKGELTAADGVWLGGKTIMSFANYILEEQVNSRASTN